MDSILKNYFFDINFEDHFHHDTVSNGFKISQNEEIILCQGLVVLKVSYIDCKTLNNLISETEKITEENIYIEKIRFQIEGNTVVHMYALEFDTLSIIINYLLEYKKDYLSMILMKNNENYSPLDICIENESSK